MLGALAGSSAAWSGSLAWIDSLPNLLVYLLLGVGAGMENVVPAIPADTFVVLGGFLSATGHLGAWWVFAATWVGNVVSALVMVHVGHRHGPRFFGSGVGRHLLNPRQMDRMADFYARWGTPAIFFTRFLPGVRAVVPVFAGVSQMRYRTIAFPLALASALWYGGLVWAGALAGRNLDRLMAILGRVNGWLLAVAGLVVVAAFAWWWRTRAHE